ncbi:MAG: SpoIIE family protein phosphatase, partial [Bacteroidia bacterium]
YIRKSINDSAGLAFSYNNLSNCYTHNTKTNSDSILYFLDLSLAIREKLKDRAGVAQNWNNIGNYYLNQEIPQKALEYYEKSYALNTELGILNERLNCLNNLSETYFDLKLFEKAKKYGEEALSAAKENAFIEMEKISYKKLAKTYSALGDFKRSSESFAKYVAINDTVFNQTLDEKLTEARINFSFETKEEKLKQEQKNKNELFAKEKRIQSIIIFSIGGGLILMLLVLVVLFRSYNLKKKANILISQQKLLVDEKNHVIEEKQKEIIDSINYAQRIQRSLLASDKLLKENLNNFFILFKPKDIVSGDFYWAKKLNNNCFALATADSTGHGVPGAIMSMLNIACLNEAVGKNITSPSEILFETRNRVIDHLKNDGSNEGGKDGMDCSLLCIDFKTLTLFAAAANNPVWIVRSINDQFELFELKPDKMPVGKHDKDQLPFTLHTFQLNKGDTIYTLTDGYPDQFGGEKGKKFMSKRLKELLLSNTGLSLQTQKEILQKTFNDWLGNLEQIDDVTIIGIKI